MSPVPPALVHSTVRIALGLTSGNTAAVLARGVLNTMLLNQLKIAASRCAHRLGLPDGGAHLGRWAEAEWRNLPTPSPWRTVAAAAGKAASKKMARPANPGPRGRRRRGRPAGRGGRGSGSMRFTDREAVGVTGQDGSFAIPIRDQRVDGTALLARSAGGDRFGFFPYGFNPTKAEADAPARIVVKPAGRSSSGVTDSNKAPVAGAAVEAAGNFAVLDNATTGPDGSVRLHIPADAKVEWIFALKSGLGFDYAEYGLIDQQGRIDRGGARPRSFPRRSR